MRKFVTGLMLCALILLVGCSAPAIDQFKSPEVLPTVAPNEYLACTALTTFNNKEEYEVFIKEHGSELPEDFFTWDDAATFGEVNGLVLLGSNKYLYGIDDISGHRFCITINRQPKLDAYKYISASTVSSDANFRKFTHNQKSYVRMQRGNFFVDILDNGNLYAAVLYINGVEIMIDGRIWEYPTNRTDTVLGKLLSPDEAVANAAFAELTEKLSK